MPPRDGERLIISLDSDGLDPAIVRFGEVPQGSIADFADVLAGP